MAIAAMPELPRPPDEGQVRRNAGFPGSVAGVGGGTLVAAMASNLPDSHPLKSWLIILAPLITGIVRGIVVWLQVVTVRWDYNRLLLACFHDAEATIQRALSDRSLSQEFKEGLKKEKEELHRGLIASKVKIFNEARKNRPG